MRVWVSKGYPLSLCTMHVLQHETLCDKDSTSVFATVAPRLICDTRISYVVAFLNALYVGFQYFVTSHICFRATDLIRHHSIFPLLHLLIAPLHT
jgi:hypothetical protein